MKNKICINAALMILLAFKTLAFNPDIQKGYFISAKAELEAMLNGKKPLSYERAIFLIENAYNDNRMDYEDFQAILDNHTDNIRLLIALNKKKPQEHGETIFQEAQQNKKEREIAFGKLKTNWAIFSYMKDSILPIQLGEKTYLVEAIPFSYSFADPMGTIDWRNTHISHLLDSNKGNCFALASLFKIFSERLHSDANLSTTPSHIFIRHKDEHDIPFNVELSNGSFPGSGTLETLTYTTSEATRNNIALRDLDLKQSVSLCLVYLAKGYEQKFGNSLDSFLFQCAETALVYDPLNLNAMLLKMELLQRKLIAQNKTIKQLQGDKDFLNFQSSVAQLYQLGYREMPLEMKNLLIKSWTKDTSVILILTNHNAPKSNHSGVTATRYASLSWGLFDEEIKYKPIERYGLVYFDAKTKAVTGFAKEQALYNDYNFDPVVFAMNVDPLAHKFPSHSPYSAFGGNPIWYNDPTGAAFVVADKAQQTTALGYINEQLGMGLFKFRGGTLQVDKKAYAAAEKNFNDNQKAIGAGLLQIVKSPRVIEGKFYKNDDINFERNPMVKSTELKFDPDLNMKVPVETSKPFYPGKGFQIPKLGQEAITLSLPEDDRAFILMNTTLSETGRFKSSTGETKPCASCIFIHELLDHGTGYIETGAVPTNNQTGVENHNKALDNVGSPVRTGEDH